MSEPIVTTEEFREMLRAGCFRVTFIKKDGSTREMLATLQEAYIEAPSFSTGTDPDHLTTVWDIEKGAWRRIITDSIQSIDVYLQHRVAYSEH